MNILLLGATGSIGKSVLSVIDQNKEDLNLYGIAINKNIDSCRQIIEDFSPSFIYIENKDIFGKQEKLHGSTFLNGDDSLRELVQDKNIDIIVSAISGFAGLKATYYAASSGKKILLANKESVVVAGDLIIPKAQSFETEIVPIDSEHNAIFQCLKGEKGVADVEKITITASGGPFINKDIKDLKKVSIEEALNHPNWKMGKKISIDSATLVNKCLELIEAKYLFNLEEKFFELVVHPQSIIHSIVTFNDGSSLCQLSNPDMRVPIANALSNNRRLPIDYKKIDFNNLELSFQSFPEDRNELQMIAREVCNSGGLLGTVFNASNEIAVACFLDGLINFDKIYEVIYRTFSDNFLSNEVTIDSIFEADKQTRIEAKKVVKSITTN